MKNLSFFFAGILLLTLSSCELVGDIFKAGMGFGIFIVIAVVGLIVFLISRLGGRR